MRFFIITVHGNRNSLEKVKLYRWLRRNCFARYNGHFILHRDQLAEVVAKIQENGNGLKLSFFPVELPLIISQHFHDSFISSMLDGEYSQILEILRREASRKLGDLAWTVYEYISSGDGKDVVRRRMETMCAQLYDLADVIASRCPGEAADIRETIEIYLDYARRCA